MYNNNKKLRILIIQNDALSLYRFREDLIKRLKLDGYYVDAISEYDSFYSPKIISLVNNYYPFEIYRWINIISDIKLLIKFSLFLLIKKFKNENYDIIHTITAKPNLIMAPIARLILGRKTRIVSLVSGLGSFLGPVVRAEGKIGLKKIILRNLLRLIFKSFNGVWLQNPDDIDAMISSKIIRHRQSVLAYGSGVSLKENFVDAKSLFSSKIKEFTKDENFFIKKYILLCAARAIEEKGILDFIKAVQLNQDWDGNFILIAPEESNDENCLNNIGEIDNLLIINQFQDPDVIDLFVTNSYAVCLPSYYNEGVPRFLLEGLCYSKPVITTNSPGCKETVVDGVNGYIVNPRDPKSLSVAMKKVFSLTKDQYQQMCLSSRKMVEKKFSSNRIYEIVKSELYNIY